LQTTATNAPIYTTNKIADASQQLETAYNIIVFGDPGDPRIICKALQGDNAEAVGRLVGYLKFHYQPLQLRTPDEFRVFGLSESDWAGDYNDHKSVSSFS
jgi:hypothetical protein